MTSFPPAPLLLQQQLALNGSLSQIAYVGWEGTKFHLAGPFAPVLGAQSGVVLKNVAHLDPPFRHLDNRGARQDGTTWYDTLYEPAEIDLVVELGGISASDTRRVISSWFGAWSPKQTGKLSWFTPERGEWWANVRMNKPVQDSFQRDWYQSKGTTFTWSARNDDAFWRSVDSVSQFKGQNEIQTVTITGGPGSGIFQLIFQGQKTGPIDIWATASDVWHALTSLPNLSENDVSVKGVAGGPFTITFKGALAQVAVDLLQATHTFTGGLSIAGVQIYRVQIGGTQSGHLPLTNIGDQPAWPRYLCYGPGTFYIGDGPGSSRYIKFGPLRDGQVALLTTQPRLRSVVDLTPNQAPQELTAFQGLISTLVNFATNNNVPPLLQDMESFFGILPPQGPLYSLLDGRFTTPIAPMQEQVGPVTSFIPCAIEGATSSSNIIAAVTPQRVWPE